MLWGIVTQTNVDHAELIWEEFTQGIQTFFSHKASHKSSLKNPKKKVTSLLIPYRRFSKVIIYYLASNNNIHRRPDSAVHHTGDDYVLGNLKFVPKGESVEVFGMAIPDPLITEAIQQSSYYPKYLKMISFRRGKPTFKLVDEDDEDQQETIPHEEAIKLSLDPALLPQGRAPVGGVTIREPVSETTYKLHEVVGKVKAIVTEEQVAHSLIDLSKKKRSTDHFMIVRRDQDPPDSTTGPSSQPEDDTSEKVIQESSSTSDSERTKSEQKPLHHKKVTKVKVKVDSPTVTSGVKHSFYLKVHENLKLITDEHIIDDKPESHSGSMSSMKNLDDSVNFGDQFLHDKPTEDDQEKSKVREESDSTFPDPSHQTVTSTPPVIPPFTEISSSKPSSLVTLSPINTEATIITTSLPEITPFIALQLRVEKLEQEMSEVKKTDLSADVLTSIRSQVPTAIDNYLGTKLNDAHIKVLVPTTTWFKPIPESKRPATPEPEWTIPPNDFPEPEHNWENAYATTFKYQRKTSFKGRCMIIGVIHQKVLQTNRKEKLRAKADLRRNPAFNLVKAFQKNNVFLQYQMDECHKLLTNKVDLYNPEGHQILQNVYELLPFRQTTVRLYILNEYNKGMETRKWSEETREEAKDFHQKQSEKRLQIEKDLTKSIKLVGGRIRDIDYSYQQTT
ncbi:hypothetical protein Tco_1152897 [Tanacetum coccineum]